MAAPAVVALYAALASSAVAAVSAVSQGDTARKVANTNADNARSQATEVSRQATQQIEGQRAKARSVIGQQLASTSESGTGLSGSNLDSLNQSLVNNEMDSMSIRYGADRNASGLNSQASIDQFQGREQQTGSYLSAAGSLLNGASRGASYTAQGSTLPYSFERNGYGGNH
jgi:hypothetical protein